MSNIPDGCELHPNIDQDIFGSPEYRQWTWGDIKEMARDMGVTDDSPVWIVDDDGKDDGPLIIRPVEMTSGGKEGFYL